MFEPIVLNFQDFISADGGQLTTTSLQVKTAFKKQHGHVLRDIQDLVAELPESYRSNFGLVYESMTYVDSSGNKVTRETGRISHYVMTRYGFTLLVMGFTGKKALAFKLAYLDAFDAMAAFIRNQTVGIRFQLDEALLADKDSRRRASLHGLGLRERQLEAPVINSTIATLRSKLEPMLPMFDDVAGTLH